MLTVEIDTSNYIGVNIKKNSDRILQLSQSHLIKKEINYARLIVSASLKLRDTPTVKSLQSKD